MGFCSLGLSTFILVKEVFGQSEASSANNWELLYLLDNMWLVVSLLSWILFFLDRLRSKTRLRNEITRIIFYVDTEYVHTSLS